MARKPTSSGSSYDRTQTIDLTRMLPAEVTTSGSFDLRKMKTTHFGKFLQAIPLPILLINESLQVVFANDACRSMLLRQHGASQASLQSLLADTSSARTIDELVREVFSTRETLTTEVHWEIDERKFWGRMTLRPVRIAGERVALLLVEDLTSEKDRLNDAVRHETELAEVNERLGHEISHRIAFEEALREREARYRHLVEHASDGIYSTDANGSFTFVNATAARICGYSPEEMLGKNYLEVVHPSYRKRVERFYGIQFVKHLAHNYYEFPLLTKYGDVRWLGQSVQIIMEGENVVGFQAVARDITDRKGLEVALRREKERFQVLAEHAPFGMLMVGKDGTFEYINPKFRELFGYELNEIPLGKEWFRRAYPDPDYRDNVISAWLADLSQTPFGEGRPRTFTVQCKDGASKIINFITVQLSSGDHFVTCEDITEQTKAREELQEKERFLAGVFSSIQDGISVLDTDLNILRVNESAERWYSHAAPLRGKKCYEAYHGADAPCEVCPCRRALETGEPAHAIKPRSGPGGETAGWLEVYCFPMQDEATGNPKGVIEYARDVTKQRKAENQLREREQLLSTITATSPVGIGLAQDRRMVWANDAWESMFGFSEAEEYVGKSVRMLYSSEEECDHVGEMLHRNLSSGKTTEVDAQMQRKDGSLFQARMRMRAIDASDPSKGFIAAVSDVTERKRAEEEIRKGKEMLEGILNATTDVVVAVNRNGKIALANSAAARSLEVKREDLIGGDIADFLPPYLLASRRGPFEKVLDTGQPVRFEDARGDVHFDNVLAPIFGDDGKVESVVAVARDITSLRRAQEAERQNALLLKTILSASPVGIGLATWDGRLEWVNDAWPAIFGFNNRDELLHENIRSLCSSPEEFHRFDQIIYHTVWDGGVAEIDVKMRRKDGSLFDAFIRASAVDPLDPSKGLISALADVTERKRAEEEVRQTKQLLETIINATPDVVVMVGIDSTVRLINSAGAARMGSTPEEMGGRSAAEYLPADTVLRRQQYLEQVIETRKPLRFEDQRGEFHYDHALTPIFNAKGEVEAVVAFARDVTERKNAEKGRREAEEKFRLFMDNSPAIAWMKDEQGRHVYLSKTYEKRFGVSLEDWLGKTDFEIWPEEVARDFWEHDQAVLRSGQAMEITEETLNPDGTRCCWWNFKFPFQDSSGMTYVAGIGVDITSQKRAQAALRESEARFREFAEAVPQIVYELDTQENFTFLNRAGLALGGYGKQDAGKGLKLRDLITPEDHERLLENTRRVLLAGESTYGNEYTVIASDGTRIPVASYSSPIVRDDKVVGMRGVCVDIRKLKEAELVLQRSRDELEQLVAERTAELESSNHQLRLEILERIKTQQALTESEERFRGIFETARDCVFIKDTSLKYTFVNPYMVKLLDVAESAIVGKTDADLFGTVAGEHLRAVDARILKGEVVEEEHTRTVKGARLTFLDVKAPLCNVEGEVVGICGISRDVTERRLLESADLPTDFQYSSRAMSAAVAAARLAAASDSTVLLSGESGSGKDYLARYIHDHSGRSAGSFYSINCAAIPSALAESELFGHEAGAFTGATKRRRGLLELAEGGTVLLNEIGELPLDLQAKLLAFLDSRTLMRIGAERAHAVNVRLIAASNKNLAAEVSSGRFRQDLFYRLDVFSIGIPPLRERLDDLPALVQELISLLAPAFGYSGPVRLHPRVMDKLRRYSWPGNVRELRNVLERALILSRGGPLRVEHLQLERHDSVGESVPVSFPMHRPLSEVLDELERSFVEEALSRSGGNKTDAARLLGISRFALARHMRKLGISPDGLA